jgi:hypothetical protein
MGSVVGSPEKGFLPLAADLTPQARLDPPLAPSTRPTTRILE